MQGPWPHGCGPSTLEAFSTSIAAHDANPPHTLRYGACLSWLFEGAACARAIALAIRERAHATRDGRFRAHRSSGPKRGPKRG